jgi:hypothetical protein
MVEAEVVFVFRFPIKGKRVDFSLFSKKIDFIVLPRIGESIVFKEFYLKVVSIEHHTLKNEITIFLEEFCVLDEEDLPEYLEFFNSWEKTERSEEYPLDLPFEE